ncbi:MAG: tyrosine--tRNA ligase, partial [Duncaniella sp.]|nr:tyrosine--tRNA ligase [Duncaniella sp.]
LAVMEGVPQFEGPLSVISEGVKLADLLTDHAAVFPSKGEMRKMVQGGGVSINKEKISDPYAPVTADMLLDSKYILVQRGKKNYYLLKVTD